MDCSILEAMLESPFVDRREADSVPRADARTDGPVTATLPDRGRFYKLFCNRPRAQPGPIRASPERGGGTHAFTRLRSIDFQGA